MLTYVCLIIAWTRLKPLNTNSHHSTFQLSQLCDPAQTKTKAKEDTHCGLCPNRANQYITADNNGSGSQSCSRVLQALHIFLPARPITDWLNQMSSANQAMLTTHDPANQTWEICRSWGTQGRNRLNYMVGPHCNYSLLCFLDGRLWGRMYSGFFEVDLTQRRCRLTQLKSQHDTAIKTF